MGDVEILGTFPEGLREQTTPMFFWKRGWVNSGFLLWMLGAFRDRIIGICYGVYIIHVLW